MLIAHANEVWIRSLESVLTPNGYATARAQSGEEVLTRASVLQPDLLLLDVDLQDLTGVQVCRRLYLENHIPAATPVLITSASVPTRPERLAILRAGAWEVFCLPADRDELLRKLGNFTRLKVETDRARAASLVDPESGLYNGLGILRRIEEMGSYARRHGRALACVALALELHDVPGAPALAAAPWIAATLRSTARSADAVGRMGPANFVVLALDAGLHGAHVMAERFVAALEGPSDEPRLDLRIGCSGISSWEGDEVSATDILTQAVTALHEAEESGLNGNRIQLFGRPPPGST